MAEIDIRQVTKRYGSLLAADDVSLHVRDGEFMTLLGPSGCGKTTLLRSVAGFVTIDSGAILIDGEMLTSVPDGVSLPPEKRRVGMVFQSYAVWPHMSVFRNIAYPLKFAKYSRAQARRRVEEIVGLLQLDGHEDKDPAQLSGGQQQRVALGRALAMQPRVLLLDEPLSNLDAKLRESMRFELKEIQRRLGVTILYVTHDQEEAMALSDRIALMNHGRVQQIGTPQEIYGRPANRFVAAFIGKANFMAAHVISIDGGHVHLSIDGDALRIDVPLEVFGDAPPEVGASGELSVRYHDATILPDSGSPPAHGAVPAEISVSTFLGDSVLHQLLVGDRRFIVQTGPEESFELGERVLLRINFARLFTDGADV